MEAFLHEILDWVSHNPGWAYALVFLVGVGESLALVGMAIPGVVLLMGAGALIASGAIAFWTAFIAATAGAVLGDGLSYSLGRHFDRRIRETWPFTRFPEQLDQWVAFFDRYGGWSVALGRFAEPVRAIVPLVAGMMRLLPGPEPGPLARGGLAATTGTPGGSARKEVVLNLIAFPATDPALLEELGPALEGVESRLPAGAHLLRVPSRIPP